METRIRTIIIKDRVENTKRSDLDVDDFPPFELGKGILERFLGAGLGKKKEELTKIKG